MLLHPTSVVDWSLQRWLPVSSLGVLAVILARCFILRSWPTGACNVGCFYSLEVKTAALAGPHVNASSPRRMSAPQRLHLGRGFLTTNSCCSHQTVGGAVSHSRGDDSPTSPLGALSF